MDVYEKGWAYLAGYAGKRLVMLLAKLTGFKPFCLYLATFLLCRGIVGEEAWLTVMVTVICSASGLRLADTLDAAGLFRRGVNKEKEYMYESYEGKKDDGEGDCAVPFSIAGGKSSLPCAGTAASASAARVRRYPARRSIRRSPALDRGRERIKELCKEAAEELKR